MRRLPLLLSALTVCFAACNESPAKAGAVQQAPVDVEWLMVGTIEPAADLIWDSVATTISAAGTEEKFPRTDAEWAAIRRSALTLVDAGKALTTVNRGQEWIDAARALATAATEIVTAADARSPEAILDTGGRLYQACLRCHQRFPGRMQNQ